MGSRDQDDLFDEGHRMIDQLERGQPPTALDWARAVLATEIVFASAPVGSGHERSITTVFSDIETIKLLREISRQVAPLCPDRHWQQVWDEAARPCCGRARPTMPLP
jgi:hypothetical protein